MTLAGAGRQTLPPPADNDADAADDAADEVSCAGIPIRTDPEWRPPSRREPPHTSYYPSAVRDAIRSDGRSSRPPSTSPSPPTPARACPSPADRPSRSAADPPPRSRRRRSRMQTRSTTTANDQQVHARRRRRLSLARRSTTTPPPYRTSPSRRWDPVPNPQSAAEPPESKTTPKPTPTPRIRCQATRLQPPPLPTRTLVRQCAHTKTRSITFACCWQEVRQAFILFLQLLFVVLFLQFWRKCALCS